MALAPKEYGQVQVTTLKNTQSMMFLSCISASFIVLPSPDAVQQSEVILSISRLLSKTVNILPLSVSKGTELVSQQDRLSCRREFC